MRANKYLRNSPFPQQHFLRPVEKDGKMQSLNNMPAFFM